MGGGRGASRGPCGVCSATSRFTCGGCGAVHYCGKEHQKQDWDKHRVTCCPFKRVTTPDQGTHLVATRRLKAAEIILEDVPLAVGPKLLTNLVCLGCHGPIPPELPRCPGCWWPLCSPECSTSSLHKEECPILARDTKHIAPPKEHGETSRYDVIYVLRILMLKSSKPVMWKVLLDMEHHSKLREKKKELEQEICFRFFSDVLGLDYTEEEVARVRGAIATNAMQIISPGGIPLRALHSRVRLFNHSCIPNVHLSFTKQNIMQARTAVPLEAGANLTVTYTGTTLPLWERKSCLNENYFFTCLCTRCSDPTEMGTHFSNPRCSSCNINFMEPCTWAGATVWVCPMCRLERSEQRVRDDANAVLSNLDMVDVVGSDSYHRLLNLLNQVEDDFHPQHYVWMKVAQMLLYMLQEHTSLKALRLRVTIWEKLAVLYEKLEPGLTRRRGMTLVELGLSMLHEVREEHEQGSSYIYVMEKRLLTVIDYLKEAEYILNLEPEGSAVRFLAERARVRREEAQELMNKIKESLVKGESTGNSSRDD